MFVRDFEYIVWDDDPPAGSVQNEGDEGDVSVTVVNTPPEPEPEPQAPTLIIDPQPSELETRVRQLEAGQSTLNAQIVELRQDISQLAPVDHEHATDPIVANLVDSLREQEAEEVAPKKRESLLYRPLFGRRN